MIAPPPASPARPIQPQPFLVHAPRERPPASQFAVATVIWGGVGGRRGGAGYLDCGTRTVDVMSHGDSD
eukprot:4685722-Pyramimonas_sp.AAC.1